MDTFFSLLFSDPILLAAAAFIIITIAILVFALGKLRMAQPAQALEEFAATPAQDQFNAEPEYRPAETSGVGEAHFQEIARQLADINSKLALIENALQQKTPGAQQQPDMNAITETIRAEMEKSLSANSMADKTISLSDPMGRLEGKLEGIHKLLILLTDSGNPEQR
ncbi:MAG: hypothetical protein A2219_04510 [Elusimicrobia bacterium RIFOXYA2_FULL_50_26]|nr:MAG: hypothetical protein A2219_04510 [Elusimicrobia bacterium RIFOXYA2_FULL_50_26]